ncbi:MAG: NADH-quinone oxidoreductase subunit N [Candidatus Marinimicrobia bacterium]|nr:NADH-quinone oxidoreductase subunit N [Candidatus Neomarinimicrobiota bacterium]
MAILFDLIPPLKKWNYYIALIGIVATGLFLSMSFGSDKSLFMGMIAIDSFSHYFKWLFLISTFAVLLVSHYTKELDGTHRAEYNTLLLIVLFGLFLMSSATNLIMVYLSIETVSIASYILAGMLKGNRASNEASLKYVIFGAFSSGLMLYGLSWLYGISGTTSFEGVRQALVSNGNPLTIYMSILMMLAGIGYKLSMVPFHFWTPDVYEGAPTPITAFLSVAPKAAGFAILIRFFGSVFSNSDLTPILGLEWPVLIAILSAATMTLGNFVAVYQNNVKRMLAYSSIAHAGYMLMAITVLSNTAIISVVFYLTIYLFMNLGAFFIAIFVENKLKAKTIEEWKGLGFRSPLVAGAMVLLLMSLTGLPPTAGFIGKVYVFSALIENDQFYWLLVVAILNSVVSLFYYFRIVKSMYLVGTDETAKVTPHPVILGCILVLSFPVILLGIYWSPLITFIQSIL